MSKDDAPTRDLSRRDVLTIGGAAGAGVLLGGIPAWAAKPPQVPRRVLGKTGEKIPILLLGGAGGFDMTFDPRLAEALRHGANYIDAADCYAGHTCEKSVGSFHTSAQVRKDIWITSKSDAHDPAGFAHTVRESLRHLRTNFVDMYFLHALQDPASLSKELMKTVEKLKKQGVIKHFGFSCHDGNVHELLRLAAKTSWVDAVMFRYNFRRYGDRELNKAMDACVKSKVGLIAMKTQASEASFRGRWVKFKQTGKWNKHQAVLKAVWADERLSAAVSGMNNLTELRENIAAAVDRKKLTQRELQELERYARATRHLACDGCDHHCGAHVPDRIRIGDTMRYLMYHDSYGEVAEARRLFARLPEAARRLQAIDFRAATAACPNGLDIAWHMARAQKVLG